MQRLILTSLLFCFCYAATAQTGITVPPDYSHIRRATHDSASADFYPTLFSRYITNDKTLTIEQYRTLYFGYYFQDGYSDSSFCKNTDQIKLLIDKDFPTSSDWKQAIPLIKECMQTEPFDLEKLNLLFTAYHSLNENATADAYQNKLEMVIKSILSTGDGRTDSSAMHILSIADEYSIISILGYEPTGEENLIGDHFDYVALKPNQDEMEGIYFNVKELLTAKQKHAASPAKAPATTKPKTAHTAAKKK